MAKIAVQFPGNSARPANIQPTNRRFERVLGFTVAVGGQKVISLLLAKSPNDIILCVPIKADLFKVQELDVEMVEIYAP